MRHLILAALALLALGGTAARAESWHYAEDEGLWQLLYDKDSIRQTSKDVYSVDVFALSFRANVDSRRARILVGYEGPSHTLLSWQMIDASGNRTRSGTGKEIATIDEIGIFPFDQHRRGALLSSLHSYVCPPVLSYMVKPVVGQSFPFLPLRETLAREALNKSLARLRPLLAEAVRDRNARLVYFTTRDGKETSQNLRIASASIDDCMSYFTLENGGKIVVTHRGRYGTGEISWQNFLMVGFSNRNVNLVIPKEFSYFFDSILEAYEVYDHLCV